MASEEARAKMRAAGRRRWRKIRAGLLPKPKQPKRRSVAHKAAIAAAAKRRYADPAARLRTAEAARRFWEGNDVAKADAAAATRARWRDQDYRERALAAMKGSIQPHPGLDDYGGYCYIIGSNSRSDGSFKVGSSFDPEKRLRELVRDGYRRWAKPGDELTLLEAFPCGYFRRVEARAHSLLGMDRYHLKNYGEIAPFAFCEIRKKIKQAIAEVGEGED